MDVRMPRAQGSARAVTYMDVRMPRAQRCTRVTRVLFSKTDKRHPGIAQRCPGPRLVCKGFVTPTLLRQEVPASAGMTAPLF